MFDVAGLGESRPNQESTHLPDTLVFPGRICLVGLAEIGDMRQSLDGRRGIYSLGFRSV